ncbi:MAG: hypothetical protein U5N86_03505 [Planctomycetota bacterium]|nr:hypothetical protein [Planctomycetota bacterium]
MSGNDSPASMALPTSSRVWVELFAVEISTSAMRVVSSADSQKPRMGAVAISSAAGELRAREWGTLRVNTLVTLYYQDIGNSLLLYAHPRKP